MGYTHYWNRDGKLDDDIFSKWKEDVHSICNVSSLNMRENYENGVISVWPVDSPTKFTFHRTRSKLPGDGGGIRDWDHFDFCKTRNRDVDEIVTGSLLALKYRFGNDVEISSDGTIVGPEDSIGRDWSDGWYLFQEAVLEGDPSADLRKKMEILLFYSE
jgi:hypothetical protein